MRVIFDLDGTLADDRHRHCFLDDPDPDWDSYYDACGDDAPIWPGLETADALIRAGHDVKIWTARPDDIRDKTLKWLGEVSFKLGSDLAAVPLRMRMANEFGADGLALKRYWLLDARRRGVKPDLVFEDRAEIVEMFRAAGVPCFQVSEGVVK